MKLRIIILLFISILFFNSCKKNDSDEVKPEFIYATILGVNDMNRDITLGDSVKLVIDYRIEDQDYSFNKLICEKLGSDSHYVERFMFKVELIKNPELREYEIDSVKWTYLPVEVGWYNIEFYNIEYDLPYSFNVDYPTIGYTLKSEDYQLIVDSVSNNPDLSQYVDSYGTGESYFGADSYYSDFNISISKRINSGQTEFETLTEEEAMNLIWDRLISSLKIVLKSKFPSANSNDKYIMTFNTYNEGSIQTYSAEFICNKIDNIISFAFTDLTEINGF